MRQRRFEFPLSSFATPRPRARARRRSVALCLASLPVVLLAITLAPSPVRAQGEASIYGLATDATGSAIAGATVRIVNTETGTVRTVSTDAAGRYDAPLLAVGEYEVSAEKTGFNVAKRTIVLVLGQHANVDLALNVAGIRQAVQVEASPFAPSVTNADVSGLVNERQVKDLPLNGRSYDQLLTLNPGVSSSGCSTKNTCLHWEHLSLLRGLSSFSESSRNRAPQDSQVITIVAMYHSLPQANSPCHGSSGEIVRNTAGFRCL